MSILSYSLLFGTIILSGSSIFLFKKVSRNVLKMLLSFSGAFLFALTVTHLIPEIYQSGDSSIGVYIFIGFFLQIVLEFFSEGIEHGHIHIHKHQNAAFPFGMMIGLCIHSFMEGIPLVQNFSDPDTQRTLLTGIILHHIPVAIALMTMLIQSGLTARSSLFYLFIFALMCPLGAFAGNSLSNSEVSNLPLLFDRIMAIVIGIFLHISTTILFETNEEHRFNYLKLLIILLGAGIAMFH